MIFYPMDFVLDYLKAWFSVQTFLIFLLSFLSAWIVWLFLRAIMIFFLSYFFRQRVCFDRVSAHLHDKPSFLSKQNHLSSPLCTYLRTFTRLFPMFSSIVQQFRLFKMKQRLSLQLPDTLDSLSQAMKAGYSLQQSLEFIEKESPPPIKQLLSSLVTELKANIPLSKAFLNLRNRVPHNDIHFLVDALSLQAKSGGNTSEILEQTSQALRDQLDLEKEIKASTAQGLYSGILVALLWPVSLFLFTYISPEYIDVLFYTPLGKLLLLIAVILEVSGFICIWNITRIKI